MPLTATQVKQAKPRDKAYKLSDEKGMFLLINPNGSKYWRVKYRFAGKEKLLALGVFPDLTLADARDMRDEARKILAKGADPGAAKRAYKQNQIEESANSFKAVAMEWFDTHMTTKSEGHKTRLLRMLKNDLYPALGSRPINQISAKDLLEPLKKIQARGAVDVGHRAKQAAGQIFRYGVATGRCDRDPSGDLKGALKPRNPKHFAAITKPAEVGLLLIAIDGYRGTPAVSLALKLSVLIFQRPGEIRMLKWENVNWDERLLEYQVRKGGNLRDHQVPLSTQAFAVLREMESHSRHRSDYVFPSARGAKRPMSDNAVRTALRTMGYDNETMSPHGFRAMGRTILHEVLNFPPDWIEHQITHAVKDPNGRAYNRTTFIPERREMMQAWADYLDNLKAQAHAGNVITANFGATA